MTIRKELSNLLKENKKIYDVTYNEISESTGISKTSVRYALNGGNKVGLDVFEKLFNYFEIKVKICGINEG